MSTVHAATPPITRRDRLRLLIERRHGQPWWAILGRLLWIDGMTQAQAAAELKLNRATVNAWSKDPRVRGYGAKEPAA